MTRGETRIAIIALTNSGAKLGEKLLDVLAGSDLFLPVNRGEQIAGANRFGDGVADAVMHVFKEYDQLVLVFSVGIAVRVLARCIENKMVDPAVVVMDEKGQFAISLLSGHRGGANALAKQVAQIVGAVPVITTASDVRETISVDLLGQEFDWEIEDWTNVVRASAAVVNGELVGVFQDAGEAWWPAERELPSNIRLVDHIADLRRPEFRAGLIISDRLLDGQPADTLAKSVVYRPKSLVVGIGCNRGTSAAEIEENVRTVLEGNKVSFRSVNSIASIDVKHSEDGLIEFAEYCGVPVLFYSAGELEDVPGVINPSEMVRRNVGCGSVCEAAALLGAGAGELVVAKSKKGNVTVAVARIPYGGQFE